VVPIGPLLALDVPAAHTPQPTEPVRVFSLPEPRPEPIVGLMPVVETLLMARSTGLPRSPYELATSLLTGECVRPVADLGALLRSLGRLSSDQLAHLNRASRLFEHRFIAAASLALALNDASTRLPPPPPPLADGGTVGGFTSTPRVPRPAPPKRPRLPLRRRAR
jgi:hypothetical protein